MISTDWTIMIDYDGTMTRSISAWRQYHEYFDTLEGMREHSKEFHASGDMGVNEWAEKDSSLWLGKRLPMPSNEGFNFKMMENLKMLSFLKTHWNVKIFVVSGSIYQLIEHSLMGASLQYNRWVEWQQAEGLMNEGQPLIDDIYAHHLKFDDDFKVMGIDYGDNEEWLFKSKRHMIDKLLIDRPDIDINKLIAVGNGRNDIGMFKFTKTGGEDKGWYKGHTIAVNPRSPKLKKMSDNVVYTNDFTDVVKAIDGFLLSQEQF